MERPKERRTFKLIEVSQCPLETLQRCGGYYACPKASSDGRRLGPLVGYAGKYDAGDGIKKQFVGDIYVNFAKAEEYPFILKHFAEQLKDRIIGEPTEKTMDEADILCGAPLGGYSFAQMLGLVLDRRVIKAEKKVTALETKDTREQSEIVFARHKVEKGANVVIVEDVCNNFSTTDKLISLIEEAGARVTAIVCLLNRSPNVEDIYDVQAAGDAQSISVISLVRLRISEYKQDNPFVSGDIARGNVVWKPKDEWDRLMVAMDTKA